MKTQVTRTATFEIITRDGKDYLFIPMKNWRLLTMEDQTNYIFGENPYKDLTKGLLGLPMIKK